MLWCFSWCFLVSCGVQCYEVMQKFANLWSNCFSQSLSSCAFVSHCAPLACSWQMHNELHLPWKGLSSGCCLSCSPTWHTLVRASRSFKYSSVWGGRKFACQYKWTYVWSMQCHVPAIDLKAPPCYTTNSEGKEWSVLTVARPKVRDLIPIVERDEKFCIIIFKELPGTWLSFAKMIS